MQLRFIVAFVLLVHAQYGFAQSGIKTKQNSDLQQPQGLDQFGWYIGAPHNQIQLSTNNTQRLQYYGVAPGNQQFVNITRSKMPLGVCHKEVPTTTLVEGDIVAPRGNGSNPTLSRIQVCCHGYQRDEHNYRKCNPICEHDCTNGICFAPNECICYPDHIKNIAGYCISTCPNGCDNGDCNGNTCVCKPGFTLEKSAKFCVPVCNPPCGKGNCTAPNTCACNSGYEANSAGLCKPKCTNGCEFGECTAPEVCTCRDGYKLLGNKCTPICLRGCVNGNCVAPNTCACNVGWTIDASGTRCEAKCDQPCLNGLCDGPNKCRCHVGYELDPNDSFRCNARCANGCTNGVCSGPDFCICNQGFIKDRSVKGSQACIPRV